MPFRQKERGHLPLIDPDTGIEFFPKDWKLRERRYIEASDDDWGAVMFVFRDPRWVGPNGAQEIGFSANGLSRPAEAKMPNGTTVGYVQWYGYEIRGIDFERSFQTYAAQTGKRLSEVREYVTEALLVHLGTVAGAVVRFV
jgi:hypothetical protein